MYNFTPDEWLAAHRREDGTYNYNGLSAALYAYYGIDGTAAAFDAPSENSELVNRILKTAGDHNFAMAHQHDDPQPARAANWLERHPRIVGMLALFVGAAVPFATGAALALMA